MQDQTPPPVPESARVPVPPRRRFGCGHVLLLMALAVLVTAVAGICIYRFYLHPRPFKPVQLNAREEQVLERKLDRIDFQRADPPPPAGLRPADLEPEAYREEGAARSIRFSERELNALLARNTDLAGNLAIDLSENLVSARLLLPMDEDFPVLGGKTLRVKTGVEFRYADGRPVVKLRGVMIMGIPLPGAWLGGLKNIDLVQEFYGDEGFWKSFADGVESLTVEDGAVTLALKE